MKHNGGRTKGMEDYGLVMFILGIAIPPKFAFIGLMETVFVDND